MLDNNDLQQVVGGVPPASAGLNNDHARASNAMVAMVGFYANALATVTAERDTWCEKAEVCGGECVGLQRINKQLVQQQVQLETGIAHAHEILKLVRDFIVAGNDPMALLSSDIIEQIDQWRAHNVRTEIGK